MRLNIYWTEFAEKELQYIFEYDRENWIELNDVFDTRPNPIKIKRPK